MLLCPAFPGLPPTPDVQKFAEEEDLLLECGDVEAATELNVRTWLGPEASPERRAFVHAMQRRAFEVQLSGPEVDPAPSKDLDLRAILAPTLVVSGGRDLEHFRKVASHLASTMSDARHLQLSWAGHLPSLERAEEVTTLLLAFVEDDPRMSTS